MKKYVISAGLSLVLLMMMQCATQKNTAYQFPAEMSPTAKTEFTKQCDKGKMLYQVNCAGCHTTKVKGKEIIPDFSAEQLEAYELREKNAQHEKSIPETKVSAEDLGLIMTFLSYKKKN